MLVSKSTLRAHPARDTAGTAVVCHIDAREWRIDTSNTSAASQSAGLDLLSAEANRDSHICIKCIPSSATLQEGREYWPPSDAVAYYGCEDSGWHCQSSRCVGIGLETSALAVMGATRPIIVSLISLAFYHYWVLLFWEKVFIFTKGRVLDHEINRNY